MLSVPRELARSALDAAPDAMIIIDGSGVVRYANRQVSELFGYTHTEVVGRPVEQLMPERFRVRHVDHRRHYADAVRVRPMGQGLALFGRRQDGSEFPVEISLSPIQHSDQGLVAAAIRDVSDRKRVEAELIEARRAADRARDVAIEARELADRANQAKSRFLATASHDLRQPLQTLALLNGTLRRLVSDRDAAEALLRQELAVAAMSRLLNALLDISKLESGAVKPDPTDFAVAALFNELRSEFGQLANRKGLTLQVDDAEVCVHSDRGLVEQILRNLISNAIKYTVQGRVTLRCQIDGTTVRVDVRDTGIGIPEDQLRFIYDEFYQVGVASQSAREGYGLGLSIVQRIVRLLGLRLDVQSEVGKGTVFSLLLPPAASQVVAPPVGSAGVAARGAQIDKPRVLLVEDDPAVRDATRMLLKVEGYRVTAVGSRDEALRAACDGEGLDLLVTDYHLAMGETGIEVISALRDKLGTQLKAVLITGDTSSAVQHLPRDPCLRIASKPVRAEELLALLRALLAG